MLLKKNTKGMSLVIVLMMIAVFSVFIIGTYTILNRHIAGTTQSETRNGAYYAAEGVVKLVSTEIDKLAMAIADEAENNNTEVTEADFITRLDNAVYAKDFYTVIKDGDIREYSVNSISVAPYSASTDKYTCLYKITCEMKSDSGISKRVSAVYGIRYLTSTSEIVKENRIIIKDGDSMIVALEDISADDESSLNGNVELAGDFDYDSHYPYVQDGTPNSELYYNKDTYFVSDTSLSKGNVKIPTIPEAPHSGYYTKPVWKNENTISTLTSLGQGTVTLNSRNTYEEYSRIDVQNLINIFGDNFGKLVINVQVDNSYILCKEMEWDNDVTLNVQNAKDFIFYIDYDGNRKKGLIMQDSARLHVNLGDNNAYIVAKNVSSSPSVAGSTPPEHLEIETTGSGTLYIFVDGFDQYSLNNYNVNITNESKVYIVFTDDFSVNDPSINAYKKVTFNAKTPANKDTAGDLNVFVIDDPETGEDSELRIYEDGYLSFNADAGTKLSLIADHIIMEGQMDISGEADLRLYAKESCELIGKRDARGNYKSLTNFTGFKDSELTEELEYQANKIVNTKMDIYYYGEEPLRVSDYKCCSNFFIAGFCDVEITDSFFYGNIYSAAREPESGEERRTLYFTDSYLSCGAVYAPRMNVQIYGNDSSPYKHYIVEKDGLGASAFAAGILATVTGTNVYIRENALVKNSSVGRYYEGGAPLVEFDYEYGVDINVNTLNYSHFYKGFKEE